MISCFPRKHADHYTIQAQVPGQVKISCSVALLTQQPLLLSVPNRQIICNQFIIEFHTFISQLIAMVMNYLVNCNTRNWCTVNISRENLFIDWKLIPGSFAFLAGFKSQLRWGFFLDILIVYVFQIFYLTPQVVTSLTC